MGVGWDEWGGVEWGGVEWGGGENKATSIPTRVQLNNTLCVAMTAS